MVMVLLAESYAVMVAEVYRDCRRGERRDIGKRPG